LNLRDVGHRCETIKQTDHRVCAFDTSRRRKKTLQTKRRYLPETSEHFPRAFRKPNRSSQHILPATCDR